MRLQKIKFFIKFISLDAKNNLPKYALQSPCLAERENFLGAH